MYLSRFQVKILKFRATNILATTSCYLRTQQLNIFATNCQKIFLYLIKIRKNTFKKKVPKGKKRTIFLMKRKEYIRKTQLNFIQITQLINIQNCIMFLEMMIRITVTKIFQVTQILLMEYFPSVAVVRCRSPTDLS